jgi:hypothetical protein
MTDRPNQYQGISLPAVAVIAAMDIGKVIHGQPMPRDALAELTRRFAQAAELPFYESNEVVAAFMASQKMGRGVAPQVLAAYIADAQGLLNPPGLPNKERLREMYEFTHAFAQAAGRHMRPLPATVEHKATLKLVVGG